MIFKKNFEMKLLYFYAYFVLFWLILSKIINKFKDKNFNQQNIHHNESSFKKIIFSY